MSDPGRNNKRPNKPGQGGPNQGGPNKPGGPGGAPPTKPGRGMFGWVMIVVLIALLLMTFNSIKQPGRDYKWSEFKNLYENNELVENSIIFKSRAIEARQKPAAADAEPTLVRVPISPEAREVRYKDLSELTNGDFKDSGGPSLWQQVLGPWLVPILFLILIWFFILRGLRGMGGGGGMLGNFGRSKHRVLSKASTGVTFSDVAGIDEAKEEVEEIIEFLKNPKKFTRLGGRIPRGVLLVGSPGCGKTLLAKAIAGEADVPFFSISGSDFVEMFVGVGASRVRDLFKQAKENSPCIIFLDEIDAVGRRRGGGFSTGGHDEREQTLNAILVEMDGFGSSDQVIVIAATNRADVLDPALTRPGRFDRQVVVQLPDIKGRLEILRVHAKKVKLGPDVNLEKIARGTPTFSGADLEAIINEAAIIATMADKDFVEHEDLEEGRDKIKFGRQRKSRVVEEEDRLATAYHEAGHAVLQIVLPNTDPLHKVTIIPRGNFGGASMSLPDKDRMGFGLKWLKSAMRVACGGRIAEEIKMDDVTSGASSDIQQVTQIARTMVLEWGMSDRLGFVRYTGSDTRESFVADRDYSDETAQIIDEEIKRLTDEAYADAKQVLKDNWDKVEAVAQALLIHETLMAEEINALMRGEQLSKPTVSQLLAAEAKKKRDALPAVKPTPREDEGTAPGAMPSPA